MSGMRDLEIIVSGRFVLMSTRLKPERRSGFDLELDLRESMRVRRVGLYGAVGGSENDVFSP